jgi:oligopeptide transport system ATP-binding protein
LLDVSHLSTTFFTRRGVVPAVEGLSFSLAAGETLGIVGESGSGKSQTLFSLMGLLPPNARVTGSVHFEGQELIGMAPAALNKLRGMRLAMVFQDPMTALNPYLTVERQLSEVVQYHRGLSRRQARDEAVAALQRVHMPEAVRQLGRYPHQLSGGMRQRVVIAMAMIGNPSLLLADEPTTALDVTIQAEILDLLAEQKDAGTAIVLVTHDLGIVARLCDRVMVMYAGRVVEAGATGDVFRDPRHPYTQGLLAAIPRLDDDIDHPRRPIEGQPPDLLALPMGCAFAPRCPWVEAICRVEQPVLLPRAAGGLLACHCGEKTG